MRTQVDRLAAALREAHPSMFGGAPRAATLEEALALYDQVARRLIQLGVRLTQGDQEASREVGPTDDDAALANIEHQLVTIERVSNGYFVRHLPSGRSVAIADGVGGLVRCAAEMLAEVNELIGEIGNRHDRDRVRVILLPGEDWIPTTPDECPHSWVERSATDKSWLCPCGATFQMTAPGRSFQDVVGGPRHP